MWPWGVVSLPMEVSDRLLQSWVQLAPPHTPAGLGLSHVPSTGSPGGWASFMLVLKDRLSWFPPVFCSLSLCLSVFYLPLVSSFVSVCISLFIPLSLSTSLFASLCFSLSFLVCLCLTLSPSLSLSFLCACWCLVCLSAPLPLPHPNLFLCVCLTLCLPFLLSPVPRTFPSLDDDNCRSLPLSWRSHKSFSFLHCPRL